MTSIKKIRNAVIDMDKEFQPDYVSPPGDTIKELMEEVGMSIYDFAEKMERTLEDTDALLQGLIPLTITDAVKLTKYLGGSTSFWISRDIQYWRWKAVRTMLCYGGEEFEMKEVGEEKES